MYGGFLYGGTLILLVSRLTFIGKVEHVMKEGRFSNGHDADFPGGSHHHSSICWPCASLSLWPIHTPVKVFHIRYVFQ